MCFYHITMSMKFNKITSYIKAIPFLSKFFLYWCACREESSTESMPTSTCAHAAQARKRNAQPGKGNGRRPMGGWVGPGNAIPMLASQPTPTSLRIQVTRSHDKHAPRRKEPTFSSLLRASGLRHAPRHHRPLRRATPRACVRLACRPS